MADDQFQLGSGNWWDHTSRSPPASISTTLNAIASFSGGGSEQSSAVDGGVLANPDLQMMGLGLSSNNMDWNQALFRGEKCEGSFRSLVQEDISSSSNTFQPPESVSSSQEHWRNKLFSGDNSSDHHDTSSITDFKSRFSIDNQSQFSSQASSNDDSTISSAAYGLFLPPENQQQQPMSNYPYQSSGGAYGANAAELVSNWSKYPPFLRTSPPKQAAGAASSSSHLHFSNNTPFWNASSPAAAMADGRPSFFPALQGQVPSAPSFDEKPKNTLEIRDSGATTKKNSNETSNKRPRNDTPSTLPAFKVRKEKMGDRITALQQLVSPFGKTDTASVLSEAIEYIKFLHEQVSVLSNPYMKNGAPIQHQQNFDKSKDLEGPNRDLRSRGLCLVPVSSTFPMTHETTNDFWTPTFGGTFR